MKFLHNLLNFRQRVFYHSGSNVEVCTVFKKSSCLFGLKKKIMLRRWTFFRPYTLLQNFFFSFLFWKTSLSCFSFQNGTICPSTSVLKVADVKIGQWEIPRGRCYMNSDRHLYFALFLNVCGTSECWQVKCLTRLKDCWNNKLSH